jgi:hypothetical protein
MTLHGSESGHSLRFDERWGVGYPQPLLEDYKRDLISLSFCSIGFAEVGFLHSIQTLVELCVIPVMLLELQASWHC